MPPAHIPSFIESEFKSKAEYEAWKKSLAGSPALAPAPAAPAAGGSGGMMSEPDFWEKEKGAPLLRRNAGYLPAGEPLPESVAVRVAGWPALCGAESPPEPPLEPCPIDEATERIFLRDAERTFADAGHRERMMSLLARVWPATKDYHQGLGYITSLLVLVFDDETCERILLRVCREPKYTPGYWHAAPEAYVRDAMVYARLVGEREPEVASLLQQACVVPEAYASKWFIGLCVHVLPFRALFPFVEAFLEHGHLFLFQFALALVSRVKDRLLTFRPTDVNLILEVLRLDGCQYADDLEGERAGKPRRRHVAGHSRGQA
jgi:hypothetical protein